MGCGIARCPGFVNEEQGARNGSLFLCAIMFAVPLLDVGDVDADLSEVEIVAIDVT